MAGAPALCKVYDAEAEERQLVELYVSKDAKLDDQTFIKLLGMMRAFGKDWNTFADEFHISAFERFIGGKVISTSQRCPLCATTC